MSCPDWNPFVSRTVTVGAVIVAATVLLFGSVGFAAGSNVVLDPPATSDGEVGDTFEIDILAEDVDDDVGAYSVTIDIDDASAGDGEIVAIDSAGVPILESDDPIAADGSHASLDVVYGDEHIEADADGTAVIGTVTVEKSEPGDFDVEYSVETLTDSDGVTYDISQFAQEGATTITDPTTDFEVTDASVNETAVEPGDDVEFDAIVENTGTESGEITVELHYSLGGSDEVVEMETVEIDGQDDAQIDYTIAFDEEGTVSPWIGNYSLVTWGASTEEIVISEPDEAFFDVTIENAPESVIEGEEIAVDAEIENTGDEHAEQTVEFLVDGSVENESVVALDGLASASVSFTYVTDGADQPDIDLEVASEDHTASHSVSIGEKTGIDIYVEDGAMDPLEDVSITIVDDEQNHVADLTTDENGAASVAVDEGEYVVEVERTGYEPDSREVSVSDSEMTYVGFGIDSLAQVTYASLEDAFVEAETGEQVDITVVAENDGDEESTIDISIGLDNIGFYDNPTLDPDGIDSDDPEEITVEAGETKETTYTLTFSETFGTEPPGYVTVNNLHAGDLAVVESDPEPDVQFGQVTLLDLESPTDELTVVPEQPVTVQVFLSNEGTAEGTKELTLVRDETEIDSETVTVPVEQSIQHQFQTTFDGTGTYELAVNDIQAGTVIVEEDDSSSSTPSPTPSPEPEPPHAEFTVDSEGPVEGEELTFDARESSVPEGQLVDYRWDLDGDGTFDETTDAPLFTHVYDDALTYDVTLEVEDDGGETDSTSMTVTVSASEENGEQDEAEDVGDADTEDGESDSADGDETAENGTEAADQPNSENSEQSDTEESGQSDTGGESDDETPGFGPVVAIGALLLVGLLIGRTSGSPPEQ